MSEVQQKINKIKCSSKVIIIIPNSQIMIKFVFLLCTLFFQLSTGFRSDSKFFFKSVKNSFALSMSPLDITGRNIEVTDALREKVNDKIGGVLKKLGQQAVSSSVSLRVEKNSASGDIVEVTILLKGGPVIRTSEASIYISS